MGNTWKLDFSVSTDNFAIYLKLINFLAPLSYYPKYSLATDIMLSLKSYKTFQVPAKTAKKSTLKVFRK